VDESEVKDYECVSLYKNFGMFFQPTSEIDIEVIWMLRNRACVSDFSSRVSLVCLSDIPKPLPCWRIDVPLKSLNCQS